jgi:hypothetical protein
MIDNVSMDHNEARLKAIKKSQLFDALIEADIQERKRWPKTIGEYAHIICNPKNPYNREFLARFPKPK